MRGGVDASLDFSPARRKSVSVAILWTFDASFRNLPLMRRWQSVFDQKPSTAIDIALKPTGFQKCLPVSDRKHLGGNWILISTGLIWNPITIGKSQSILARSVTNVRFHSEKREQHKMLPNGSEFFQRPSLYEHQWNAVSSSKSLLVSLLIVFAKWHCS